jgi:glycosyltransferase involved in cell wall biosynthesis
MKKLMSQIKFIFLHPKIAFRQFSKRLSRSGFQSADPIEISNQFKYLTKIMKDEREKKDKVNKISWICLPSTAEGGGITTISRFVSFLESIGLEQEIIIYAGGKWFDIESQRKVLYNQLGISRRVNILSSTDIDRVDYAVATGWQSWGYATSVSEKSRRMVFLQDDETLFEPYGDSQILIKKLLPEFNDCISFGSWLETIALKSGVRNTGHFRAGVDEIYFNSPLPRKKQIVFYFQPEKNRRLPGLTLQVAQQLKKKLPNWSIVLFGSSGITKFESGIINLGVLNKLELSSLYRRSSIGVVFSASNASLLPLEMVSCGLHVVSNDGENVEWIDFNHEVIKFTTAEPEQIIDEIMKLVRDEHQKLRKDVTISPWEFLIKECVNDFVEKNPKSAFSEYIVKATKTI